MLVEGGLGAQCGAGHSGFAMGEPLEAVLCCATREPGSGNKPPFMRGPAENQNAVSKPQTANSLKLDISSSRKTQVGICDLAAGTAHNEKKAQPFFLHKPVFLVNNHGTGGRQRRNHGLACPRRDSEGYTGLDVVGRRFICRLHKRLLGTLRVPFNNLQTRARDYKSWQLDGVATGCGQVRLQELTHSCLSRQSHFTETKRKNVTIAGSQPHRRAGAVPGHLPAALTIYIYSFTWPNSHKHTQTHTHTHTRTHTHTKTHSISNNLSLSRFLSLSFSLLLSLSLHESLSLYYF